MSQDSLTFTTPDGITINLEETLHPDTSQRSVLCDLCFEPVHLTPSGGLYYFTRHRGTKSCKKTAKRRTNAAETAAALDVARTLVCFHFFHTDIY